MEVEKVGNAYRVPRPYTGTGEVNAYEERSIQWATRNHQTSMVQTMHRSKQPSDGKVCGMRASRKSLQSGRSMNCKPKLNHFSVVVRGDDMPIPTRAELVANHRAESKAVWGRMYVKGQ